jgi:hypothetical protein
MTTDLFAAAAEMAARSSAIREFEGLMTREEAERLGKLDAEEWRHACEVRAVLDLPTVAERREYLDLAEKRRGATAGQKLRDAVTAEWLRRREELAGQA